MVKSTVSSYLRGLVPLGPKKITRMTTNPEKERYLILTILIHLPLELNDLWRDVYQSGYKVELVEPLNPMALELERWEKPVSIGLPGSIIEHS